MTEAEKIRLMMKWAGISGAQWNPYTSRDQCAMLEDEVARRGLQGAYGDHLCDVLKRVGYYVTSFDLAHASIDKRCQAVLRLIEGEKK